MAKDESALLPIWWRYYSQFFCPEDMYILDHETTDGSTSGLGFVRIPVLHSTVDWGWHRDMMQRYQHELIQRYEIVLCTDVDEIVTPDPAAGTLGDYMNHFAKDFVTCTGYEVIHLKQEEDKLDLSRPVLEQRSYWFFNPSYSKPLLARVPMYWHGGLHSRVDGLRADDPNLYLMHLHRVDYDLCLARHRQRTSLSWNQRDVDENWGYQDRITEPEAFHNWFYHDSCGNVPIHIERIPSSFKGLI